MLRENELVMVDDYRLTGLGRYIGPAENDQCYIQSCVTSAIKVFPSELVKPLTAKKYCTCPQRHAVKAAHKLGCRLKRS